MLFWDYIFPSENILQNNPCLIEVPQTTFGYYNAGGCVETCIKSVQFWLDMCTRKGEVMLTLHYSLCYGTLWIALCGAFWSLFSVVNLNVMKEITSSAQIIWEKVVWCH